MFFVVVNVLIVVVLLTLLLLSVKVVICENIAIAFLISSIALIPEKFIGSDVIDFKYFYCHCNYHCKHDKRNTDITHIYVKHTNTTITNIVIADNTMTNIIFADIIIGNIAIATTSTVHNVMI